MIQKRHTMTAVCWTLVTLFGWVAIAQGQSCPSVVDPHSYCSFDCAPEDRLVRTADPTTEAYDYCRRYFRFAPDHILPEEWELMFDSHDYQDLVGTVFLSRGFDSDTTGWTQRGGICQYDLRACAHAMGLQNNWVFSRHIKYPPGSTTVGGGYSTEVYLNITVRFSQCTSDPACSNDFVTLYRYDTNSIASETARTNNNNYNTPLLGQGTEDTDSRFRQTGTSDVNVVRSFTPTGGSTGFHLGIRDTGTCGQVRRILIYYTPCKEFHDGLVSYPELVRPPEGSPPNVGEACCAPNSHHTSQSLNFTAYSASDGRCERNVRCECDAGYRNGSGCEACGAGKYRSLSDPQEACLSCPQNTLMDAVNASICECIDNHFRADSEGPGVACTGPPGPPGTPNCSKNTGTLIELRWEPPSDEGGRTDTYYIVEYQDVSSTDAFISSDRVYENSYNITGLEPITQYRVRVVAENRVSAQDTRPNIRATRTSTTVCQTGEGKPEPPSGVQVVENIVFLWQPPLKPNGVITGYQVSISYRLIPSTEDTTLPPNELNASTFVYVLRRGVVPENVTATITVSAKTSAGYGISSDPIVFEPFGTAACEESVECTLENMSVQLYIGLTALIAVVAAAAISVFVTLCCVCCVCRKYCLGDDKDSSYKMPKNGYSNRVEMSDSKINWT